MTEIKKCDCKHSGQDALHGAQNRVHNSTNGKKGNWRCTACGVNKP